jgi:hypothetical protein
MFQLLLFLVCFVKASFSDDNDDLSADVFVYGATPAGIFSAIAAAKRNSSVILYNYEVRVGGMCSSGLSFTDVGDSNSIGGLALDFFLRNARHYNVTATMPDFLLEPHVAESLFQTMMNEQSSLLQIIHSPGSTIVSVSSDNEKMLQKVSFSDGRNFNAIAFIDASYTGDLLSLSNISFALGREPSIQYNESLAGVTRGNSFPLDPRISNTSGSALLPGMTGTHAGVIGSGDMKIQSYTFRLCLTRDSGNLIPFQKSVNYNSSEFELLRRYAIRLSDPKISSFLSLEPLHDGKFDLNNGGFISTDLIGGSWNYTLGDSSLRKQIWEKHFEYVSGLLWTLANDIAIPKVIRDNVNSLGLCADEFISNSGWPEQLYVREARRMIGEKVFLQSDIDTRPSFGNESIGLGSYTWDSHAAQRVPCLVNYSIHPAECVTVTENDLERIFEEGLSDNIAVHAMQEGDPGARTEIDYELPIWLLFPNPIEAINLVSPTCPSASHVAFSSVRTEPALMALGHAAGDIAALFINSGGKGRIQDVDTSILNSWLHEEGAKIAHS